MNNWIICREKVLKKVREIKTVSSHEEELFKKIIKNSIKNITSWNTENIFQQKKIKSLLKDVNKFMKFLENQFSFQTEYPFNKIYLWLEKETWDECIEYIVSIMMEPFDDIVKPLIKQMSSDEDLYFNIPTERTIGDLKMIIKNKYPDIVKMNFKKKENNKNFWFISKNKEEPRYADRFKENGSELEQPLAIARDIKKLNDNLAFYDENLTIDIFLSQNSELRHVVRRAFIIEKFPYAEIQDNTIGEKVVPIDMLRLKLSFFGALKFDPRSDKWLRICMFQGAPLPQELKDFDEHWVYNF